MARYSSKSFKSRRRVPRPPVPDVQLSKDDLAQLDAAALPALTPEQLHALSVKLLADFKLAHARLDRNPRNSSRPPSSMAPWDRAGPTPVGGRNGDEETVESRLLRRSNNLSDEVCSRGNRERGTDYDGSARAESDIGCALDGHVVCTECIASFIRPRVGNGESRQI